jgi:hypothetical protein
MTVGKLDNDRKWIDTVMASRCVLDFGRGRPWETGGLHRYYNLTLDIHE